MYKETEDSEKEVGWWYHKRPSKEGIHDMRAGQKTSCRNAKLVSSEKEIMIIVLLLDKATKFSREKSPLS